MKDVKTLLLVLLSGGLICTWVILFKEKSLTNRQRIEISIRDSIANVKKIQDSIHALYASSIADTGINRDSTFLNEEKLTGEGNNDFIAINRLDSDIISMLQSNNASPDQLELARKKISELQQLVQELTDKKTTLENDKQQMSVMLENAKTRLKKFEESNASPAVDKSKTAKNTTVNNVPVQVAVVAAKEKNINTTSPFQTSEIKLQPVVVKDDSEVEPASINKANKLLVSFAVKNNITEEKNAEVFVVVIQPDGKVMRTDLWEANTMTTQNEGKKAYTRKLRFYHEKGETQKLNFSLNADTFLKGNYQLQVYHNGYKIGQATKPLN